MWPGRLGKWLVSMAVAGASLASRAPAFAQGCPLCYTAVAAAKSSAIRALQSGIFVLLVPPLLIIGAIVGVAFARRDRFN